MVYFTYDASGERVRKVRVNASGRRWERIYLGPFEMYRIVNGNGNLRFERQTLHISDNQSRVALVDTLTVDDGNTIANPVSVQRYQLNNHLESASLELDENADLISYEEFYPFGSTSYRAGRSNSEVNAKRYRYVGKEKDNETGLYYYGARYYASWLARFVSVDPLKDKYTQLAPYQYASNNPVSDVDIDGLEGTKQKEPPKTFQGLPILSQRQIAIGEGEDRVVQRETRFKIRPGLGGRVTENIFGSGNNQRTERVSQGIFGIDRQVTKDDSFDFNQTFQSEKSLPDFTVTGSAPDIKEVFAPISSNSTNNFVFPTSGGIAISRLSTDDRKFLGVALEGASINPVVGIAKIFAEIYAGTADDGTGRDALSVSGTFVKSLEKASNIFGAGLNVLNAAEIATSDPTREEIITGLIFDFIANGLDPEIRGKKVNNRDNLIFVEGASDVNKVKGRLNAAFNLFEQFINQNPEIDITKEGGRAKAFQNVFQGLKDLGKNARLYQEY